MLTKSDVLSAIRDLADVHSVPKHWPGDMDRIAGRFLSTLLEPPMVDALRLEAAVRAYLASDAAFFPKPGALRQLALQQRRPSARGSVADYLAWEHDWRRQDLDGRATFTACPACGARPGWETGRLQVRHIQHLHFDVGLPVIGHSDRAEELYADHKPAVQDPAA